MKERDALVSDLPPPYPVMTAQEGGMPGGLFSQHSGRADSYSRQLHASRDGRPASHAFVFRGNLNRRSPRVVDAANSRAWVASTQNPLTARVIVNRVWQWHFGEGLVRTPNNFGLISEPPTHPALLDWLAAQFVEDGWSLKKLQRRIMLSATYQQTSAIPRAQAARDPENRWLGRFSARRFEAEAIRDSMIFVSGQLDPSPGGPAGADSTRSVARCTFRPRVGTAVSSRRCLMPPTRTLPRA